MKQSISPKVAVIIIAIVVLIIGVFFWQGQGPGKNKDAIERAIDARGGTPMPMMPGMKTPTAPGR